MATCAAKTETRAAKRVRADYGQRTWLFFGVCLRRCLEAAMRTPAGQHLGVTDASSKGVFLGSDCAWLDGIESHQI